MPYSLKDKLNTEIHGHSCHSELLGGSLYFEQSSGNIKSVLNIYCLKICDISCSLIENLLVSARKAILIQEDFNQPLNYP